MREKNVDLLKGEVKRFAINQGVDNVGVASVGSLLEAGLPEGYRPWDIQPGAKSIVSFIMAGIYTPRLVGKHWKLGTAEHSINFVLMGSGWPGGYTDGCCGV